MSEYFVGHNVVVSNDHIFKSPLEAIIFWALVGLILWVGIFFGARGIWRLFS